MYRKTRTLLTIGNFDAAYGTAFYTTQVMSTPLTASGQGDWVESTVFVQSRDQGETAAVTLSGGNEYPNDATFFVKNAEGGLIPFELSPRVFEINERPIPVASSDMMGTCTTVAFDGTASSDAEGAPLAYLWRFGDGEETTQSSATHEYTKEGHFVASLEVVDGSPQLGNGATVNVPVFVKNSPVIHSKKRLSVAVGEENAFDGSASSVGAEWEIARHEWDFGDGTTTEGALVLHTYTEPGTYTVTHTITDDSGHRCDNASEQFAVRANAKPAAVAGADRRISIGEETVFDASASSDADDTPLVYHWDLRDGTTSSEAIVRHSYAEPGTYQVGLLIDDESGVANSADSDGVVVIVNDPPIPEAGVDRSVAIDETLTFDAGASVDRDGTILAYDWDFGDGATASGIEVDHAYAQSGTYVVRLRVTNNSTTNTAVVDDTLSVRVNEPPIAVAGPEGASRSARRRSSTPAPAATSTTRSPIINGISATAAQRQVRSSATPMRNRRPIRSSS